MSGACFWRQVRQAQVPAVFKAESRSPVDRRSNVKGLLLHVDFTGRILLDKEDDRFKCHCCGKPIGDSYRASIYVDSNQDVWCITCWYRALESTVRAVDKNPNDKHPKYVLRGGNYYQRLRP